MQTVKSINLQQTAEILRNSKRVLLCTHLQPDGDAIGSLLAATALLRKMGKHVVPVCHDPVPQNLWVLPGYEDIRLPKEIKEHDFDLTCSLDASDLARLGDAGPLFLACGNNLVIDHHASNTFFGASNHVDSSVAATGNLVFRLFEALDIALDPDTAALLYAAISTDTGNFSFGQMNEEFFIQVSKLMHAGLDITYYARVLHLVKDLSFYRLLGRALASLKFECDGKLSNMRLTLRDFEETGTSQDLAEGLVNRALNIPGVCMCYLATQMTEQQTKFSLRALAPYNVAQIAVEFGGGGHVLAAGCTVDIPLDEAMEKMSARMKTAICP